MDNIFKDLYFGCYAAFKRKFAPSSSHAEAIDRVVELKEKRNLEILLCLLHQSGNNIHDTPTNHVFVPQRILTR